MYARDTALWAEQPRQMTPLAVIQWRYDRDLSQQQVADLLGIDRKTLSRWECGRRRVPLWLSVALRGLDAAWTTRYAV